MLDDEALGKIVSDALCAYWNEMGLTLHWHGPWETLPKGNKGVHIAIGNAVREAVMGDVTAELADSRLAITAANEEIEKLYDKLRISMDNETELREELAAVTAETNCKQRRLHE